MKTTHPIRYALYVLALKLLGRYNSIQYFTAIEDFEEKSKKYSDAHTIKELRRLCMYAYENTKYYQKLFDDLKFDPKTINSFKDFERIPILKKDDVKQYLSKLSSSDSSYCNKRIKNTTGGSTGIPIKYYQSYDYYDASIAYQFFNWYRTGYRFGDKMAFIWGSEYDFKIRSIKEKINDLISNRIYLNTFNASEEEYILFAKKLKKFKPKIIVAYASSAYLFAKILKKNDIKSIKPDAIQVSAETLYPHQRKLIEEVFRCKVYNSYGCREVSSIAHECPKHDKLHICSWLNYVEIVNKKGKGTKGKTGKVLVTNLHNYAMPMIRYELGDVATPSKYSCHCGIKSNTLKEIKGRITDIIISPEGNFVHGEYFTHLFYELEYIKQFQVVQETRNRLTITVVTNNQINKNNFENFMRKKIHKEISKRFDIEFKYSRKIPSEKSGKHRFTISKVQAL
jgi:phenylacetate-CoA ligase